MGIGTKFEATGFKRNVATFKKPTKPEMWVFKMVFRKHHMCIKE